MCIHSEKFSSKQSSFLSTCTGTDFHYNILIIVRVFRKKQNLNLIFQLLHSLLGRVKLLFSHLKQFFIAFFIQHCKTIINILLAALIFVESCNNRKNIILFFHETPEFILVINHIRITELRCYILISVYNILKSVKHIHNYLSISIPQCYMRNYINQTYMIIICDTAHRHCLQPGLHNSVKTCQILYYFDISKSCLFHNH